MSLMKERIKEKRTECGLSQVELANLVGVTPRTIQNYELGKSRPKTFEAVKKLSEALNTTPEFIVGSAADLHVLEAYEKGGASAAKDINDLVGEVKGVFAGGQLDDTALDGVMKALTEAYWIAKEKNKKYGRTNKNADKEA